MCEDQQLLAWQGDIRKRMRLFQLDAEPEEASPALPSSEQSNDAAAAPPPPQAEKMDTDQNTTINPA